MSSTTGDVSSPSPALRPPPDARSAAMQLGRPTAVVDIDASPSTVFAVLTDPRTYPEWLLGARHIRGVDDAWPAAGSAFHHTVGLGPLEVHDRTEVLRCVDAEELRLEAHIGPFGRAEVTFRLDPLPGGGTRVELREVPRGGLVRLGWYSLMRGWVAFGLWGRNQLTLDRLRDLVEAAVPGGAGARTR